MAIINIKTRTKEKETGKPSIKEKQIDTEKTAIIAIDTWNYHWCKTFSAAAGSFVPRFNKAFYAARKLGMKVIFAPTTASAFYSGHPLHEKCIPLGLKHEPPEKIIDVPDLPEIKHFDNCGYPEDSADGFSCMMHFSVLRLSSALELDQDDHIASNTNEVCGILKEYGIEHVIHTGFATNMCLIGKQGGIKDLVSRGYDCVFTRDLTAGITRYLPGEYHYDDGTEEVIELIETYMEPSIDLGDELKKLGMWSNDAVDHVHFAPWGIENREYTFSRSVTASMSYSFARDAKIRYTKDGSVPDKDSAIYDGPVEVSESMVMCAAAFDDENNKISLDTYSYYHRLGDIPPLPDIYISDIDAEIATLPNGAMRYYLTDVKLKRDLEFKGYRYQWDQEHRESVPPPQRDRSYMGGPIKVRGKEHKKGIGVYAPSNLVYKLKPEYKRAVGLAAADETVMNYNGGRETAIYPTVVFRIFIDGKLIKESPVLMVGELPWRFDIEIPEGASYISFAATDAGDGNREDFANWVDTGFICE